MDRYIERLLRDFDGPADLAVAWDPGNGAAGEATRRLTARLPGPAGANLRSLLLPAGL